VGDAVVDAADDDDDIDDRSVFGIVVSILLDQWQVAKVTPSKHSKVFSVDLNMDDDDIVLVNNNLRIDVFRMVILLLLQVADRRATRGRVNLRCEVMVHNHNSCRGRRTPE
jgi:hypothetical protein